MMQQQTRVNDKIRIATVRLIDPEGQQVGIVSLKVAREAARQQGLDLVEVAAESRPPVVRLMDWSKHQYEKQKAERQARRLQQTTALKELKFRPATDDHDREHKLRHARKFLEKGKRVKVSVVFHRAELRRPEPGFELLARIAAELGDLCKVESQSREITGRQISMVLAPA